MSIQSVLAADISGRGHPGRVAMSSVIGLVVNVLLNIWWIPRLGVVGAALASSVSYTVMAMILLFIFGRLSGVPAWTALLLTRNDVSRIAGHVGGLWSKRF